MSVSKSFLNDRGSWQGLPAFVTMTHCNVHDSNCMSVWISDTCIIQSWQQLYVCGSGGAGWGDNYPRATGEKARTQHESSLSEDMASIIYGVMMVNAHGLEMLFGSCRSVFLKCA